MAQTRPRASDPIPADATETLRAGAERRGISERSIRRSIADGHLPAWRFGKRVFFRPADLDGLFTRIPSADSAA